MATVKNGTSSGSGTSAVAGAAGGKNKGGGGGGSVAKKTDLLQAVFGKVAYGLRVVEGISKSVKKWAEDPTHKASIGMIADKVASAGMQLHAVQEALSALKAHGFVPVNARARGMKIDIVAGVHVWIKPKFAAGYAEVYTAAELDNIVVEKVIAEGRALLQVKGTTKVLGLESISRLTSIKPIQ